MKYIITCNDNTQKQLVNEFKYYRIPGTFHWFNSTEALFDTTLDLDTFYKKIIGYPMIFVRHFTSVDATTSLDNIGVIENINMDQNLTFSIQLSSPVEIRNQIVELRNHLVDTFKKDGLVLDVKNPQQVLTIYVNNDTVYYGINKTEQLLSKWASGAIHFSRALSTISRAEYKLREVFDVFPLKLEGNIAVDLGAAPGGWSKVLNDLGFEVYAIDPAELDSRLLSLESIHHKKMTSQQFIHDNPNFTCDLMVNDMKMSSRQSIHIFEDLAQNLSKNGLGIITIKLPKNYTFSDALEALNLLRNTFEIVNARQLFHNRNEFTAIVRKTKD